MKMNDNLIQIRKILELTGLSKTTIYDRIKVNKKFPRPIKYGKMTLWSENAVHQWIKDLKAAAGYED